MANKIILLFIGCLFSISNCTNMYADVPFSVPTVTVSSVKPNTPSSSVYFQFSDFPKNQEILCTISRPIFNKKNQLAKFKINDLGKIIIPDNKEEEALEMKTVGFLQGERVTATFHTQDEYVIASVSFIPNILSHKIHQKNLVLEAELTSIGILTNYELTIQGMQEGEKFTFQSKSGTELIESEVSYSSKNKMGLNQDVLGELGGIGELRIITKNGTLFLQLPWGYRLFDTSSPGKAKELL